jgi:hypothetical protein
MNQAPWKWVREPLFSLSQGAERQRLLDTPSTLVSAKQRQWNQANRPQLEYSFRLLSLQTQKPGKM